MCGVVKHLAEPWAGCDLDDDGDLAGEPGAEEFEHRGHY